MASEELAALCESIAARERHMRDFYKHHFGDDGWQALLSRDLAIAPSIEENYARLFTQLKEKYGANVEGGGDVLLAELARHMALTAVSEDRARRLHPEQLAGYERLVEWRKRVSGLGAPPELGLSSGDPAYARALEEQQRAIHAHLTDELADSGAHTDELAQMARTIAGHRLHAAYAAKMAAS
jgi:hypothetical protein